MTNPILGVESGEHHPAPPVAAVSTPHGLWSLWDMLVSYAYIYFLAGQFLGEVPPNVFVWELMHQDKPKVIGSDDIAHRKALRALKFAKELCHKLPLGTLVNEIDRAIKEYEHAALTDRLKMELERLGEKFLDELEERKFLYVPPELANFYDQKQLFGMVVFDKFKAARDDIKNAGNCYAVGQPTACVFHLMRAMEIAVRKLARRPHMNITITPKTTWRQITGAMDKKIADMPDGNSREKNRKENWEASRANLHHVGSVWRNSTMHPAKTYTPSQARDVLDACRVFMSGLCAL